MQTQDRIGTVVIMGGRGWIVRGEHFDEFVGDHVLILERLDHADARRDAICSGKTAPRIRVAFAVAADVRFK